jgi:hypothetical protein
MSRRGNPCRVNAGSGRNGANSVKLQALSRRILELIVRRWDTLFWLALMIALAAVAWSAWTPGTGSAS